MVNREVLAYSIASGFSSGELADSINAAVQDGWQPYGSPITLGEEVLQSMVKYSSTNVFKEAYCKALNLHGGK